MELAQPTTMPMMVAPLYDCSSATSVNCKIATQLISGGGHALPSCKECFEWSLCNRSTRITTIIRIGKSRLRLRLGLAMHSEILTSCYYLADITHCLCSYQSPWRTEPALSL